MTDNQKESSKIVTDENWKEQAQREKEKLSQEKQKTIPTDQAAEPTAPAGALPPADFTTLMNSLLIQVMFCLGRLGAPDGSPPEINLDLAKHHIDLMEVLEEKTKGNLSDDESKKLALALHEARMQYVQAAGGSPGLCGGWGGLRLPGHLPELVIHVLEAHGDLLAHPGLFRGNAVQGVGHAHGPLVVGDDDELGVVEEVV